MRQSEKRGLKANFYIAMAAKDADMTQRLKATKKRTATGAPIREPKSRK